MSFSDFNLKEDFISSIEAAGYQSPTPLQSQLIPLVAQRKSALVWTQSASGKTGAFLIPAINYILENPAPEKRGARILILTSRRDRVSQINYTIKRLSSDYVMRFGFIVSGRPYQTQMRLMRRPLDIMIATPGRLNDLMNNGKADFSQLEMLIIDDLTSIYRKNLHGLVEKIIEQAGDSCSSISFVRGDDEITAYARSLFADVTEITIENENEEMDSAEVLNQNNNQVAVQTVEKKSFAENKKVSPEPALIIEELMPQNVYVADDYTHKIAMMDHLMDEFAGESTIVYVSTSKAAKMLNENLANHGHAAELVQDLNPEEIDDSDILICSDQDSTFLSEEQIASNDKHIIHFDLPRKTEQYIKRMNQHVQKRGEAALLMVDGYNFNELKHIEKTIGEKLEQVNVPGLEPLKPFVNLSKSKPTHKQRNNSRNAKPNKNTSTKANKNNQSRNKPNNRKKQKPQSNSDNASSNNNSTTTNSKQRRQRKGAFGRLNGGANRKTAGGKVANARGRNANNTGRRAPKVGVSSRGTGAPAGDRGWQSDFAAPKERKAESKNVVIRYSKKRTIASPDKDSDDV